nr:unnamed protein product [Callosobruchus analis]
MLLYPILVVLVFYALQRHGLWMTL